MTQPQTGLAWSTRTDRVVRHIADHLDDVLDLNALADIACFSPWHFHRVFTAITGETVQDCVRRLRLHRAAVELSRPDPPLERVAQRAGYGSLAAFSRAFASAYGTPPGAWRKRGLALRSDPATSGDLIMTPSPASAPVHYDVTLGTFEPLRLIAIDHTGDYQAIGRSFDRLFAWAGPRGLVGPETRSIGIYYDDPAATPASQLRSKACMSAPEGTEPGPGMAWITLTGGPFASVLHKGPYADLDVAYAWLYRGWLPGSGHEPANEPAFEEYLNNPRAVPPQELLTRVHLPLKA